MIENERQLEQAYEAIARNIRQRDQALGEAAWDASLRQIVADGIEAQRRKLEREIANYLAAKMLSIQEATPVTAG